ncbi:MAG TPA: hypothetical protein VFS67_24055 [Polyangiaceae bacterium]|nr:hypothetical protein [Polyangiaceae bacterium]
MAHEEICEFEHCDDQVFAQEAREAAVAREVAREAAVDGADFQELGSCEGEASREETPHWVSLRAAASEAQRAARKQRQREAYQREKARRANDPRLQQLKLQQKEAAKARRREHYERVKQHRKAAKAAGKAVRSLERASAESAERAFFAKGRVRLSKAELNRGASELVPAAFANAVAANDIAVNDIR